MIPTEGLASGILLFFDISRENSLLQEAEVLSGSSRGYLVLPRALVMCWASYLDSLGGTVGVPEERGERST